MDLSTLNPLQQGTLFVLLIIGHAFPIFGIITLLRARKLRSALKDNANKHKGKRTESLLPTLQIHEKQMACGKFIGKAKATNTAIEFQAEILSPCEPGRSWNDDGFIVITDLRHPGQATSITVIDDTNDVGNRKTCISSLSSQFKGMIQRAADHLSCRGSANCNELGGVEYMALSLIALLVVLYSIGCLILGIVSIGLWSKFVRPDIPREDETSPFWAGAFLATSAFCNNGMSLIDTNMGPYQKEWVISSL